MLCGTQTPVCPLLMIKFWEDYRQVVMGADLVQHKLRCSEWRPVLLCLCLDAYSCLCLCLQLPMTMPTVYECRNRLKYWSFLAQTEHIHCFCHKPFLISSVDIVQRSVTGCENCRIGLSSEKVHLTKYATACWLLESNDWIMVRIFKDGSNPQHLLPCRILLLFLCRLDVWKWVSQTLSRVASAVQNSGHLWARRISVTNVLVRLCVSRLKLSCLVVGEFC